MKTMLKVKAMKASDKEGKRTGKGALHKDKLAKMARAPETYTPKKGGKRLALEHEGPDAPAKKIRKAYIVVLSLLL